METHELLREVESHRGAFSKRYGEGGGTRLFFAPGRVNLMGAHLDYNGGPVLPTAIDRGTFLAARSSSGARISLASTIQQQGFEFELSQFPFEPTGTWCDYPLGVLRGVLERLRLKGQLAKAGGLELLFGGNLAVGAGLSSSASICVTTALGLSSVWGLELKRQELVDIALEAEREFVGVHCGSMDPHAVGHARPGFLLWLDCKDNSWEHLPIGTTDLALAVADTGVRRKLAAGAFNQRVAECGLAFEQLRVFQPGATCLRDISPETLAAHRDQLEPVVARRAQHVLDEVQRTFAARDALLAGRPKDFGRAMTAAHHSLRDLFEVSCPELDLLVESAIQQPGVLGTRLTGAGFGGCTVIALERGAEADLRTRLTEDFRSSFGREPRIDLYHGDKGPREIQLA